MCVFIISPVPITEPLTSELIDTPVFYNLAPRPIKYRVSVPIPTDVPVLAERSVDNNLLEETAGADLISHAELPISGLSSFQAEAMEAATETATAPYRPTATH